MTLKQFRKKHEGHSVALLPTAHDMRKNIVGNIAFNESMVEYERKNTKPKGRRNVLVENYEATIRSQKEMLADLEGIA